MMQPAGGLRIRIASMSAVTAVLGDSWPAVAQLTTSRLKASRITTAQSHPSPVRIWVASVNQSAFSTTAAKLRFTKSVTSGFRAGGADRGRDLILHRAALIPLT